MILTRLYRNPHGTGRQAALGRREGFPRKAEGGAEPGDILPALGARGQRLLGEGGGGLWSPCSLPHGKPEKAQGLECQL